jgi:hypothetical protein
MPQPSTDETAEAVAKAAVIRLFGAEAIDHVDVFPTEDQTGEAGLSVTIFLNTPRQVMPSGRLLDTIAEVSTALREVDDFRFPYVTFLAPGYEHAEDDASPSA